MKTLRDEPATAKRARRVTVELQPGEKLMSFKEDDYYQLGGQVEHVVQGHVITESDRVYWCSVAQRWVA
jgi:hypothetical protein